MENLEATVEYYLRSRTDYAILINGLWGVGKTHYFKNHIVPLIASISVQATGSKYFKPIFISLYGLKSIQEVQTQIFYKLNPKLDNKGVKYSIAVGRAIAKGLLKADDVDFGPVIDDLIKAAGVAVEEGDMVEYKYNPLVICFDDVERRGISFSYSELFGFINTLTQELGVKTILIANEEEDLDKTNFKAKKEKVIGVTIEFVPDLRNVITEIVKGRYVAEGLVVFKEYLLSNISFFVEYLNSRTINLRTLVYSLDAYQEIYSKIITQLDEDEDVLNRVKKDTLKFTLAICIEYREGRITYKDINKLKIYDPVDMLPAMNAVARFHARKEIVKKNDDNKEDFRDRFRQTYYDDNEFLFLESIFNFITTANPRHIEEFLTPELKKKYGLKKNESTPDHIHVYDVLSNNAYSLSDSDYKVYTRKLIHYLEIGAYEHLTMYYSGYNLVMGFDNILGYKQEKLVKRIIRGVKRAKIETYSYSYEINLPVPDNDNPKPVDDLILAILDANKGVMNREIQSDIIAINASFENDTFSTFVELITNKTRSWRHGYLKSIPSRKIISALKTKNIDFVSAFNRFIKSRYDDYTISQLEEEVYMRELLIELINMKTTKRKKIAILWVAESIKACLLSTTVQ